jgi:hypothetical protein
MTHFGETLWQNMFQKPINKLLGRERDLAGLLGAVIAITESDFTLIESLDPAIADGHPEEITRQIVQNFIATARVLAMHDPGLRPDGAGGLLPQLSLTKGVVDFRPEDHRQGAHGDEEGGILWSQPALAVRGDSARADQQVDMRVIAHGAGPGVEHGQDGGAGAQVLRIGRELEDRRRRTLEQGPVKEFLVSKGQRA